MTFGKLFALGFILVVLLSAVRISFDSFLNLDSRVIYYLMLVLMAVIAIATVRRLGVISYLEAMSVIGLWIVMLIAFDFLVTSFALGLKMFGQLDTWRGYLVVALAILLVHKKRHVEIRREMAKPK